MSDRYELVENAPPENAPPGRFWVPPRTGIRCLTCKNVSWNPTDVAQRYCGYCHVFHDDAAALVRDKSGNVAP
jgi:hypothetical protein